MQFFHGRSVRPLGRPRHLLSNGNDGESIRMRLLRFGANGEEKPGLLDDEGAIRDLSGTIVDLTPDLLDDASLARLEAIDPASLPRVKGSPRFGIPVAGSRKFIAI